MLFYLGTHQPGWLGRADVPLFVSARRLRGYGNAIVPQAAALFVRAFMRRRRGVGR